MDVNLFIPINVRVKDVLNDSYTITWDISAAAKAALADAVVAPTLNVYGRNAVTSVVTILGSVSAANAKFEFVVRSGISEVYLTAALNGIETVASASVSLLSTNLMTEGRSVAIGKDENGNARMIATTSDGVVKVTGVTVNNYGGDASAANQVSMLAKTDTVITSTNDVKTAVNNVVSGLGGVGLNAATVIALQTVAVTNIPNDFPDVDTTAAINSFKAVAAKDTTLNTIASNTANVLKSTDLSLSMGVLDTSVTNFPSDFPNSALLLEQLEHKSYLSGISTTLGTVDTTLTTVSNNVTLNKDTNVSSLATLGNIDTKIGVSNTTLTSINTTVTNTSTNTQLNGTKLDAIAILASNLLKTSDLNLAAGTLSVTESSPITDFPDSAAQLLLTGIRADVQGLGNARVVTFGESLPTGNNSIGSVTVTGCSLPTNAATESTLSTAVVALNTGNVNTSNLRTAVAEISSKLSSVMEISSAPRQDIIYDVVHEVVSEKIIRPEAEVDPATLVQHHDYILQLFSYDNLGNVSLFRETAIDNNNYYHTMPSYSQISMFTKSVFEAELALVRNIAIKITGTGKFRVRITGRK